MGRKPDLNAPQTNTQRPNKHQVSNRENDDDKKEKDKNKEEGNKQDENKKEESQKGNDSLGLRKNGNVDKTVKQVEKKALKKLVESKAGKTVANNQFVDKAMDKAVEKGHVVLKISVVVTILITVIVTLLSLVMLILPALLIVLFFDGDSDSSGSAMATGGYYPINCQEVNVIFVDKEEGYKVTGNKTYPLEEYVAGVVNGEIGGFQNLEVYKQFAIAARSFYLSNEDNCKIEASARKQVFSEVTGTSANADLMRQAAEETKGQVLLDENGKIYNSEYDAFCSIAVDSNYYTISQQNQKIPYDWVEKQGSSIAPEWKQGTCEGNHGRGMSQWGSYYLATEQNYKYDELIDYYLKDKNVRISTTSIAGLDVKVTTDATNIHEPIETFLSSRGSSLEEYNNFIKESVKKAGVGTRAGAIAAAVSSINYLYDNYHYMIPYYYGGEHMGIGVPSFVGEVGATSHGNRHQGFDCSGYISWVIMNGGYKFTRTLADDFQYYVPSSDVCSSSDPNCIGEPGDLFESSGHVTMILAADTNSGYYYVAESNGGDTGVVINDAYSIRQSGYHVVHMDSFYNNSANVLSEY